MLNKKKVISVLITTMILVGSFGAFSYGNTISKTLEAWYGTVRIIVDGENVTHKVEPFIVDGTTYIPLRVVAETFNKNVEWNPSTSTATITDDLTQVDDYYQSEILKRDVEIMSLKSKIKRLEDDLEKIEEEESVDLDDLEDDLNDDFDEYRDVEFDINLDGDEDEVEVEIEVDLDDYKREWDDLSESRIESYLQDIVDEILDVYEDADIEGVIIDTDEDEDLIEFTVTKRGNVDIEERYEDIDISDLEEDLDDEYNDYFRNIDLYIELDGDEDDIEFIIDIDYDKFEDEWEDLSDNDIEELMADIYNDIEDELRKDAEIEGYVYDYINKENLAKYYLRSGGREVFTRY